MAERKKSKSNVARVSVNLDTVKCFTGNVQIYTGVGKQAGQTIIIIDYVNPEDALINRTEE